MRCLLLTLLILFPAAAFAADASPATGKTDAVDSRSLSSQYYTVKLPDGWRTVMAPEEKQGNVNAIFATSDGSCVVTIVMGPTLGADAKSVAGMFADEFHASSPPTQKNKEYIFTFPQKEGMAQATVSVADHTFKLVTVYGDRKKADAFLASAIAPVEKDGETSAEPATEQAAGTNEAGGEAKASETAPAEQTAKEKTARESAEKPKKPDNVYSCPYYTATLPEGWKAVQAPVEQEGNTNAIFANPSVGAAITLVVGPSLGADAETIASMFAEQFKATGPIKTQNGRKVFSFLQNDLPTQAIVSVSGSEFMLTTIRGKTKDTDDFLKNALKSENYEALMPR